MKKTLSTISIVCVFAVILLLIFHGLRDEDSNNFKLIAHGASSNRVYRFDMIDSETLAVYHGRIRRNQTSGGLYADGFFMNSERRGMVLAEGFFAVLRREEITLTPEESKELMRLTKEVEMDAPEDAGFMIFGGEAWYAILRYNDAYYTVAFIAPTRSGSFPDMPHRPFSDDGATMIDLLNELSELSPFPVDIRRSS